MNNRLKKLLSVALGIALVATSVIPTGFKKADAATTLYDHTDIQQGDIITLGGEDFVVVSTETNTGKKTQNNKTGLFLLQADTDEKPNNFGKIEQQATKSGKYGEVKDSNGYVAYFRNLHEEQFANDYRGSYVQNAADSFYATFSDVEKSAVMLTDLPQTSRLSSSKVLSSTEVGFLNKKFASTTLYYPKMQYYGDLAVSNQRLFALSAIEVFKLTQGNTIEKTIAKSRNATGISDNNDVYCKYYTRSMYSISNTIGYGCGVYKSGSGVDWNEGGVSLASCRFALNLNCDNIAFRMTKDASKNTYTNRPTYQIVDKGYTVNFTDGGETVETKNVKVGQRLSEPTYEAPNMEADGYTFQGWYKEGTTPEKDDPFDFEYDTITEDTTLYAAYTLSAPKNIRITESTVGSATTLNVAWEAHKKAGVSYKVYAEKNGTTATSTTPSTQYSLSTTNDAAGTTISVYVVATIGTGDSAETSLPSETQVYKKGGYTVTFMNESVAYGTTQKVQYNGTISAPANPKKDGYTFLGWYNGDEAFDFATGKVTKDLTLTAKYELNTVSDLTVTETGTNAVLSWTPVQKSGVKYDLYKKVGIQTAKVVKADIAVTNLTTKATYSDDISAVGKKTQLQYYVVAKDGSAISPRSVTATMLKGYKTVTFNGEDGKLIKKEDVETGSAVPVTSLVPPAKAGYTFDGWFTSAGTQLTAATAVTDSMIVTAKYTLNKITDLKRGAVAPKKVVLSWTPSASPTATYEVYRGTTKIATLKAGIKTYTDTKPTQGVANKYGVYVVDGTNRSALSNVITANVCEAKATLSKAVSAKKSVKLTFKASKNAKVEIYYSTKKTSGFKKVATTAAKAKTYTVKKLTSKKTYYFKIRYITSDKTCVSAYSAVKSAKAK